MHDEQRSREPEIAPELNALEQQLRRMTLASPRIDRDRLMYAAGQAAGAASSEGPGQDGRAIYDNAGRQRYIAGPFRASRFWQVATCTMTAATLLLATMLVWQDRRPPLAQQQSLPQPAVDAARSPKELDVEAGRQLATRNNWPAIPSIDSGYLRVRYAALTRGVDTWRPTPQTFAGDGDSYDETPRTQRKMLEELLPSSKHQIHPQSSF